MSGAYGRTVVAATLLLGALLVMWIFVTPPYRGPDEPQHASTAVRLASGGGYPPPFTPRVHRAVDASSRWVEFLGRAKRGPLNNRPRDLAQPPTMRELARAPLPDDSRPRDQMTQHPPGYYAFLAAGINVLGLEDASPQGMMLALRLLSAALLLPIPALIAMVGTRMGLAAPGAVAAAYLPAAWVEFVHIGAVLNNGTLLVLGTSVLALCLMAVIDRPSRGSALAAGLALSIALLAKGFALALALTVAIALVGVLRRGSFTATARSALWMVLGGLPGAVWWIINVVRYGHLQPSPSLDAARVVEVTQLGEWLPRFAWILSWSTWWALGWAETQVPAIIHAPPTMLLVVLLIAGSVVLRRSPVKVALLHSLWLGPLAIVVYGSVSVFLTSEVVGAVHGRYLQSGIVALAVLSIAAVARWSRLMVAVPAVAAIIGCVGVVLGIRHFWSPVPLGRVGNLLDWWALPAAWVWVAGLLTAGAAVWGTIEMGRLTRADRHCAAPAAAGDRR